MHTKSTGWLSWGIGIAGWKRTPSSVYIAHDVQIPVRVGVASVANECDRRVDQYLGSFIRTRRQTLTGNAQTLTSRGVVQKALQRWKRTPSRFYEKSLEQ